MLKSLVFLPALFVAARKPVLAGYWENWVDVDWWQNNLPGNCVDGCVKPAAFMSKITNYSVVNYGFTFLTTNPQPDQINCTSGPCPVWNDNLYIAANHPVIQSASDVTAFPAGLVAIGEACRLAKQGPAGPKRCSISLGGWSDFARIGTSDNAKAIGKLVGKMILLTHADGVDLDFEHLSEYSDKFDYDEFAVFNELVLAIRNEFDTTVSANWKASATARADELLKEYNALPDWQQKESFYFNTSIDYLAQVASQDVPHLSICWTTRFNAWVNPADPFDYLDPSSPVPSQPFQTDNEGMKIWPQIADAVDSINIMAYDAGSPAGPLVINFEQVLSNFVKYGKVDKAKINMGFEPGSQYAGGQWEGLERDLKAAKWGADNGFGGNMVWSINSNDEESTKWCPLVADALHDLIQPEYPYPNPPTFTQVDPTTGWML